MKNNNMPKFDKSNGMARIEKNKMQTNVLRNIDNAFKTITR